MSRYLLPLIAVIFLVVFLSIGLQRGAPRALPSPYIGNGFPSNAFKIMCGISFSGNWQGP